MEFDVAVVGSGFAGALLSMIARQLGHSVVLLEKTGHPRFAIGESSTPLANLLLEELATRYDLPRLLPLCKWGAWQRAYPEIGCGLKRGFSFYHHEFGQHFQEANSRSDQLLVAASPRDDIADTHWYRPDFDHFLVREAQDLGACYLDHVSLQPPVFENEGVSLRGQKDGHDVSIRARWLFDASGPRGFLHRALGFGEVVSPDVPGTQGLYTHFRGVETWQSLLSSEDETPPYPVDDAALHHVFEGGWIWVLRFGNGLVSAGVAASDSLANELRFHEGAPAWARLMERLPSVKRMFAGAVPARDFVHAKRLSFRSQTVIGPQFALLPSTAGFINPLLSTGFPLALLGVSRLAHALEHDFRSHRFDEKMCDYAAQTQAELCITEDLIAALCANMGDFELFKALTLLYFAAASFSETVRRLDKPELAGGFLMNANPHFGPPARACFARARRQPKGKERRQLIEHINEIVRPFDVAGLTGQGKNNWFPVVAEDLLSAGDKVGASREELELLLRRAGF